MLGDVEPQAAWKLLRPRSSASVVPVLIQGISLSVLRGSLAFPETSVVPISILGFFAHFAAFLCVLSGKELLTAKIAKKGRKVRKDLLN